MSGRLTLHERTILTVLEGRVKEQQDIFDAEYDKLTPGTRQWLAGHIVQAESAVKDVKNILGIE